MSRILIVEDEVHLATGIKFNLEMEGYEVLVVGDGAPALERLARVREKSERPFDLVILDVMLPSVDGFQVANQMRESGDYTPILMLTAKSLPQDVVQGLELGADDYLAKPFDLAVLLARIKGLLRRRDWAQGHEPGDLATARIGDAVVDFRTFEIEGAQGSARLTLLEAMLLKLLVQNAGRIVTKAEILEKVWNVSAETETRAVDNFIARLRRHVEVDSRSPRHLHTVRGAGYRLTP
jgi:two-component system, OmpR family, alkaline phosphatase synthesis response regulator PhoP